MGIKRRMQIINRRRKAEVKSREETKAAKEHIRLSEKDKQVIELIRMHGCMNVSAIKSNFGVNASKQAVKASVDRLVKIGLVKSAHTEARKRSEEIYWIGKRPAYTEISHMLLAAEVLGYIASHTQNNLINHKSEHELKSENSLNNARDPNVQVPDKWVAYEKSGQVASYNIEIDSYSYTGHRLLTKAEGLSIWTGNTPLLWICYSTKRVQTVTSAVKGIYPNIQPILFSDLKLL